MVASLTKIPHRLLRQRHQPLRQSRDRHARRRVRVHGALQIMPRHVHGGVNGEARRIHAVTIVQRDVAVHIHPNQAGRRDLLKPQAIRVQQELVVRIGDTGGEMGES